MMPAGAPRLRLRGITKRYADVVANEGVDLCVAVGEIHAVLGENGAGKSTLMKIIYGAAQPDSGSLAWEGRPMVMRTPAHARRIGIGMVFQAFFAVRHLDGGRERCVGVGRPGAAA